MSIKSLAVFCGSKDGRSELFRSEAAVLGQWMASRQISLIYGGGNVGLMGIVANAVMDHGGAVTGVIPEILDARERSHKTITELLVVGDMHIRKRKMYELCDAAVILPGGYGTLDELFEMITWNNLSIHDKPIYIINLNGFYNHLLKHIELMLEEGFLYENPLYKITVLNNIEALMEVPELNQR
ncbi:TIGR00730 family Rossman fold protein [Niabella insulamsoli]|uniref:LOG family protein n=1 Tax=Niabella insulamsoli TaxID=3144874 RepID=UPI0031FBF3C3